MAENVDANVGTIKQIKEQKSVQKTDVTLGAMF